MSFPRYPRYKDSGVEWLGEVPEHWEVKRLSSLSTKITNGYVGPTRDILRDEGIRYLQSLHIKQNQINFDQPYFVGREWSEAHPKSILKTGDVLIVQTGDIGQVAVVTEDFEGCNCHALIILTPLKSSVGGEWIAWVLNADYGLHSLVSVQTGALHPHLNCSDIKDIYIPVPPSDEQALIVRFINHETAKIDALIAEQQRLIDLLKEKRQAVISHAVTKGLNPNVRMKDSGIEWLGEVPEHWIVGRAGFYIRVLSGFAFPSAGFTQDESAPRLLRGVNVGVGTIRWEDVVRWHRKAGDDLESYEVRTGELVIGMDRPLISEGMRIARVKQGDLPCLLLQRVASIRSDERLSPDFLELLLASPMFEAHFAPETTGVSVPHISPHQIQSFMIGIPPRTEQDLIISRVRNTTAQFNTLVAEGKCAIELLQERRTALVSAAVTGQIDVRGFQPAEAA